eukprot:COSAG01_NODE_2618_length_7371_cov_13.342959_8_plen_84_part_00
MREARLSRRLAAWSVCKPRAPPSTVPIPHDAADELHLDDFLFVFPTHQPLTFSTHERGLIPQIRGVVVNKVFASERARVLHEH